MALTREKETYLSALEMLERNGARAGPSWVRQLRRAAVAYFSETSFPTTREEDWKYTSVAPIERTAFRPAPEDGASGLTAREIERLAIGEPTWVQLVFVNGGYSAELSSIPRLPGGVRAGNLADAVVGDATLAEEHLARYAGYDTNAFVALNTAFLQDGAFVYVPRDVALPEPVHLVFVSAAGETPTVSDPRVLIVVDRGGAATVVESYVAASDGRYFTNAVTEATVGDGAILNHYKILREGGRSFHIGRTQVSQGRESVFSSFSLTMGGELARNDLNVLLDAEGAECTLNGLYIATGSQHVDNHTAIDHCKPHGTSRQLYKGILDGKARGVFNGKIFVRPGAQKTDAHQTNKNLLLSDDATVDAKPQLEIFADDVKCTHGAAIGQLDPDMLFYLKSRGLRHQTARALLTYGFARDVLGKIGIEGIRSPLDNLLAGMLQAGAFSGGPS